MNTDFQDIQCKKINIYEYLWKSVSKLILILALRSLRTLR